MAKRVAARQPRGRVIGSLAQLYGQARNVVDVDPALTVGALQLNQAAITVATETVAGHQVPQILLQRKFIHDALRCDALLSEIPAGNVYEVDGESAEIPRITPEAFGVVGGLADTAEVDDDDVFDMTFSQRIITPEPFELQAKVTQRFIDECVEQEGFSSTLDLICALRFGKSMEAASMRGEADGSNPSGWPTGLGTTIDGWKVIFGGGNVYDHQGSGVGPNLFSSLWLELPVEKRHQGIGNYAYWCHPDVEEYMRRWLYTNRQTELGDWGITTDGQLRYRSIPIRTHPFIDTDAAGELTQSATTSGLTYVLLCEAENLYAGYNPRMRHWIGARQTDGKYRYLHLDCQFGVQAGILEWLGLAVNVSPSVAS